MVRTLIKMLSSSKLKYSFRISFKPAAAIRGFLPIPLELQHSGNTGSMTAVSIVAVLPGASIPTATRILPAVVVRGCRWTEAKCLVPLKHAYRGVQELHRGGVDAALLNLDVTAGLQSTIRTNTDEGNSSRPLDHESRGESATPSSYRYPREQQDSSIKLMKPQPPSALQG